MSRACPLLPRSAEVWSTPPVGASAISFSAVWQATASCLRPASSASRPRPNRSDAAAATEHSSAAELDSPAPINSVDPITMSTPRTGCPAWRNAHSTPAA
ncbi:hypothetical protein MAJHIDBO_00815 [Propionibacterium freudenreichii subsp. shermanii]|nr:hypothetical protein MAJHIDBO_00815 [Propionibacterium freudenreichii subsp. shermanii]SPS08618.1 hypothetical protein MAJHIDBO_00815 [Propionibacterium freudenreichii subsp. shermanii]